MAATAALSAAAVGDLAAGGSDAFVQLTVTLGLVVGILALAAGLLRLGFLASFISEPVLKGFIVGLALTIIVGQVPKLFGVPKGEGDFFRQVWDLLGNLGDTSGLTLLVGLLSLALVLGLRRFAPLSPARWSRSCSGSPPSSCSTSTRTASRSSATSRAGSRRSGCPTSPRTATSTSRRPRSG